MEIEYYGELLTPDQAAKILIVTPECIRNWARKGRLNSVKLGSLVRIYSAEIERVIQFGLRPYRYFR